jgi:hypothetical protein
MDNLIIVTLHVAHRDLFNLGARRKPQVFAANAMSLWSPAACGFVLADNTGIYAIAGS